MFKIKILGFGAKRKGLGRLGVRCEDDIKMNLKGIE